MSAGGVNSNPILSGELKTYFEADAIRSRKIDKYNNVFTQFIAKRRGLVVKVRTDTRVYYLKRRNFESWCKENRVSEDLSNYRSLDPLAVDLIKKSFHNQKIKSDKEKIQLILKEISELPGAFSGDDWNLQRSIIRNVDMHGYAICTSTGELWFRDPTDKKKPIRLEMEKKSDHLAFKVPAGLQLQYHKLDELLRSKAFNEALKNVLMKQDPDASALISLLQEQIKSARPSFE